MKRAMKSRLVRLMACVITVLMVMSSTVTVLAATQDGNGGAAFAGAATNTFAAGMPLSEIYFDASKIDYNNSEVSITNDPNNALSLYDNMQVRIKGSALSDNTKDNNIKASTQIKYKDAAILPDGTLKDVVLTVEIGRVMTATTGSSSVSMPQYTFIQNRERNEPGINFAVSTGEPTGIAGAFFGIGVEQKVTISVDGAGDFVVPFYGFNQNRNNANSYVALRTVHDNDGYHMAIETAMVPDSNVFYPRNNENFITASGGNFIHRGGSETFYDPPNQHGTTSSIVDDGDGYQAGFATIGQSGFQATINAACSENQGSSYPNNQYIALGDLIHRIWSGSGVGGEIKALKGDAAETELKGGTFKSTNVPSGMPANNDTATGLDLMRYVVPDAKAGVTYTMAPKKGYTLEKVVVDGNTYIVPDTPEASATIKSTDGDGTLTYLGGGEFKYSFDKPNTKDHEIYVTWKEVTADIKITKFWNDGDNASGKRPSAMPVIELTDDNGGTHTPVAVSNANDKTVVDDDNDGLTWKNLPVFKYNADGDATDPITYTITEKPSPAYAAATNAGFDLADASKTNGAREKNDPYTATVTNTLKKDVEITKTWDDQNDKYGLRPGDVAGMFTLYTDAAASTAADAPPTPTESGSGNSITVKWSGVPAFDANGNVITYYAKETVPTGYKADPDTGIVAAGGTITNTLQDPPTGKDATSKGGKGQSQTGTPVFEKGTADIPSTGAYTLLDKSGNPTDSVTVPGEGKYTINKDTGEVTFEPEPDFTGTASGVTVQVTDADGLTGTANYKPTVVNTTEEKTIKRVIKYTYQTKDGKIAHKEVVQELPAKREGTYDPDNPKADKNGIVWTDNWTFPNGKTFPAVKNPSISGWKTDDVAEAYTISGADDKPPTVYIVYQKDKKKSGTGGSSSGSSAAPAAPAAQPIVTPIPGEQPVTPPPASPGPAAQATGDSSRMALWGGIGIVAILAFAALLRKRRR